MTEPTTHDDEIRRLVARLSRPHRSGGKVIERAAILASGADTTAILEWIAAHAGEPEEAAAPTASGGLHSSRLSERSTAATREPLRYVLPAGALG